MASKQEPRMKIGAYGNIQRNTENTKDIRIWTKKFYELQQKLHQEDELQLTDVLLWMGSRWMTGSCDEETVGVILAKLARSCRKNDVAAMIVNGIMMFNEPAKSAMARICLEIGVRSRKLNLPKNRQLVIGLWNFARETGLVEEPRKTTDGAFHRAYTLKIAKRRRPPDERENPYSEFSTYLMDHADQI